jgi:N-acyl-D-aspartate/D-glutamate deacylase
MAIRKLSGAQADMLGLADRGYLREGMWADVVVFDADTIAPGAIRRVRDFPANSERLTADNPTGVQHVLVNGTPIRAEGKQVNTELRPGRIVRPPARQLVP